MPWSAHAGAKLAGVFFDGAEIDARVFLDKLDVVADVFRETDFGAAKVFWCVEGFI
jgi:hypothetical protein